MAQFIPTVPGIGAALGTGLSKSLETLAEGKIKQMIQQPQNDRLSQIMSYLSGAPIGKPQSAQPNVDQLAGQESPQSSQGLVPQSQQQPRKIDQQTFQQLLSGLNPQQQAQAVAAYQNQQKIEGQERRHQENKSLQERALLHKIAGPELIKSAERTEVARKNIGILDNIIKLAEKGDIRSGTFHSALASVGLQRWGSNVDTQLAQAMINDYNASQIESFSGRGQLTNRKFQALEDAGPALWKTPEGIIAVSKNKKLAEQAHIILDDAENEIVDEYGSKLPINWKRIAAKRAEPKLQNLTDKAAKNIEDVLSGRYSTLGKSEGQSSESSGVGGYSIGEDASNLTRNVLRTGSRVLENVGGAVGSGLSIVPDLLNAVSGGATPSYEDIQSKVPLPPTISQVSKFAQEKSGGYLTPKNAAEEFSDQVIPDLVTFLAPVGGKVPFRNAIIKAVGGNTASWLAKSLGASPLVQGGVKLGFNVLASLPGGRKSLEKISKDSYQESEKLAEGKSVPRGSIHKVAQEIFDKYGEDRVGSEFVKERAKNLANLTKEGDNISLNKLWDTKKNLNEFLSDYSTPEAAKAPIKRMVGAINETIKEHAPKDFVKALNKADEIHAGLKSASDTSKFLKENLDKPTLDLPVVSWLVKNWAAPIAKGAVKLGKNLVFGQAAEKALDASSFFDLLKRSPHAKQYYEGLVKASLAKDVIAAKRSAEKLNKVVVNYLGKSSDQDQQD